MRYVVAALIAVVALGIYLLSTQPTDRAAPGQTQIRFAFPGSVKAISLYSRLVRRFMELNPDIHVKLEPNVGDFRQIAKRDLIVAYMWLKMAMPNKAEAIAINKKYDPEKKLPQVTTKMNKFQIGEAEKRLNELAKRR